MRILGLDYGARTVGVAVSDPLGLTAQGVEIIRRKSENKLRQTLARIEELVAEYQAERLVLGLPKHMNNDIGDRAVKSLEFQEILKRRTGLDVVMWDERLTTVEANRVFRKPGCAAPTESSTWTSWLPYLFCRVIWIVCTIRRVIRICGRWRKLVL